MNEKNITRLTRIDIKIEKIHFTIWMVTHRTVSLKHLQFRHAISI